MPGREENTNVLAISKKLQLSYRGKCYTNVAIKGRPSQNKYSAAREFPGGPVVRTFS